MFPDYRPDEWDVSDPNEPEIPGSAPEPEPPPNYESPPF
jgi:hypothetical protein